MLKVWKKSWEPFGSCLLNSTANPAKLGWKWAGLAVLFSRQLPNGSHDFFQTFSIYFLNYFIKNSQTTIALPFLTHNISAAGGVTFVVLGMNTNSWHFQCFTSWGKWWKFNAYTLNVSIYHINSFANGIPVSIQKSWMIFWKNEPIHCS